MTPMNGVKHDVEDILASIRTSIADRSPGWEGEKRELRVPTLRGRSAIAEEAMDFELPAIFKEAGEGAPERTNLLGRLSEVLTTAGGGHDRSRTVIPFDPPHGRMIEPPPGKPESAAAEVVVEKLAAENDSVKRIMPTFFDTRMSRMAVPAPVEPEEKPEPVARHADEGRPQPPRLPGLSAVDREHESVEDAAAQLLRPILKQWLSENMPKIVEKALQNEVGGGRGPGSRH